MIGRKMRRNIRKRFFFHPSANRQREADINLTLSFIDWLARMLLTYDVLWEAKEQDFPPSHGKEYGDI